MRIEQEHEREGEREKEGGRGQKSARRGERDKKGKSERGIERVREGEWERGKEQRGRERLRKEIKRVEWDGRERDGVKGGLVNCNLVCLLVFSEAKQTHWNW